MEALGIIEIKGLASAIYVSDVMVKTAAVKLEEPELTKGSGWTLIKITGNVSAVTAAINAGETAAQLFHGFVSSKIIPRPADDMARTFSITDPDIVDSDKIENGSQEFIESEAKQITKKEPVISEQHTKPEPVKPKPTGSTVSIKKETKKTAGR
ncbi:MAG: BMC domain-containing protein [Clostridiales Family XIII bacterium]|jgi:microcompartment protein CcmL/EutN|nr:BMC domain-containing protein [Clostridiales Family XIII bacterium]